MAEIVARAEGSKTVTIKLSADRHLKFFKIARELEISPNDLAQEVIDHFMDDYEKEESERLYPPVGAKT